MEELVQAADTSADDRDSRDAHYLQDEMSNTDMNESLHGGRKRRSDECSLSILPRCRTVIERLQLFSANYYLNVPYEQRPKRWQGPNVVVVTKDHLKRSRNRMHQDRLLNKYYLADAEFRNRVDKEEIDVKEAVAWIFLFFLPAGLHSVEKNANLMLARVLLGMPPLDARL